MKTLVRYLTCACATALACTANAALNIPSDGSDGELIVTVSTNIDLGLAVTGNWDANNSANAGKGIYDPAKWAVIFKYSSVSIANGATVTFKNHLKKAPVVWLVQSNATINGTVNLNGQDAQTAPWMAEAGPGGFRGGSGRYAQGAYAGAGFGPGGAIYSGNEGYGGSYGTQGEGGPAVYGNPSLLPLVGGSGAGGANDYYGGNASGGAGGGAILIAAGRSLIVGGRLQANGGVNANQYTGGCGSGGGIRLIAETIEGSGSVYAVGGTGRNEGGLGRISVERFSASAGVKFLPSPNSVDLPVGGTPQIWLSETGPAVKIVSIGDKTVPSDPSAEFGAVGADTVLPLATNATVVVETIGVEANSTVTIRATPRANGSYLERNAQVVTNNAPVLYWAATLPVQTGYSAIQVKVVRP